MTSVDTTPVLDHDKLVTFIERKWNDEILHALTDYIAIPAKSPAFDPDWAARGYLERVVTDAAQWAERQPVKGLKLEIVRLPGRTPVIFFETPATRSGSTDTILLYGHLDKQPEFDGWRADLARGRRSSRTASCTAAAARTTVTRSTRASRRSARSTSRASGGRAASA